MDKDRQRDYARRISQASRTELVVITYEIILEEIENANAFYRDGAVNDYRAALKRAQQFLSELMRALDFKYSISGQMFGLYEYVQRILVKCEISGCPENLENAENVLKRLMSAFREVAKCDTSGSVMENTQSIYAGLTYGRGSLNEMNMTDGTNRGFLA